MQYRNVLLCNKCLPVIRMALHEVRVSLSKAARHYSMDDWTSPESAGQKTKQLDTTKHSLDNFFLARVSWGLTYQQHLLQPPACASSQSHASCPAATAVGRGCGHLPALARRVARTKVHNDESNGPKGWIASSRFQRFQWGSHWGPPCCAADLAGMSPCTMHQNALQRETHQWWSQNWPAELPQENQLGCADT